MEWESNGPEKSVVTVTEKPEQSQVNDLEKSEPKQEEDLIEPVKAQVPVKASVFPKTPVVRSLTLDEVLDGKSWSQAMSELPIESSKWNNLTKFKYCMTKFKLWISLTKERKYEFKNNLFGLGVEKENVVCSKAINETYTYPGVLEKEIDLEAYCCREKSKFKLLGEVK